MILYFWHCENVVFLSLYSLSYFLESKVSLYSKLGSVKHTRCGSYQNLNLAFMQIDCLHFSLCCFPIFLGDVTFSPSSEQTFFFTLFLVEPLALYISATAVSKLSVRLLLYVPSWKHFTVVTTSRPHMQMTFLAVLISHCHFQPLPQCGHVWERWGCTGRCEGYEGWPMPPVPHVKVDMLSFYPVVFYISGHLSSLFSSRWGLGPFLTSGPAVKL